MDTHSHTHTENEAALAALIGLDLKAAEEQRSGETMVLPSAEGAAA